MADCRLHLANGWTVSISDSDTPPAICSVAAWPSTLDDAKRTDADWFKFDDRGNIDARCWTLEDIREALAKVEAAEAPGGLR